MDEAEAIAQMKAGNIAALRTLMEMYQVQAVQATVLITQDRAAANLMRSTLSPPVSHLTTFAYTRFSN